MTDLCGGQLSPALWSKTARFGSMPSDIVLYRDYRPPPPQPPSSCQPGETAELVYVSFSPSPCIISSLPSVSQHFVGRLVPHKEAADGQGLLKEITSPADSSSAIRI